MFYWWILECTYLFDLLYRLLSYYISTCMQPVYVRNKKNSNQSIDVSVREHLWWTMVAPDSSYSCLLIHILSKRTEAKIDPPIQAEYLRGSQWGMMLISVVDGTRAIICIRSAMPGNIDEPPASTTFAHKSLLMSPSHFLIVLYNISWTPSSSIPRRDGWKLEDNLIWKYTKCIPWTGPLDSESVRYRWWWLDQEKMIRLLRGQVIGLELVPDQSFVLDQPPNTAAVVQHWLSLIFSSTARLFWSSRTYTGLDTAVLRARSKRQLFDLEVLKWFSYQAKRIKRIEYRRIKLSEIFISITVRIIRMTRFWCVFEARNHCERRFADRKIVCQSLQQHFLVSFGLDR